MSRLTHEEEKKLGAFYFQLPLCQKKKKNSPSDDPTPQKRERDFGSGEKSQTNDPGFLSLFFLQPKLLFPPPPHEPTDASTQPTYYQEEERVINNEEWFQDQLWKGGGGRGRRNLASASKGGKEKENRSFIKFCLKNDFLNYVVRRKREKIDIIYARNVFHCTFEVNGGAASCTPSAASRSDSSILSGGDPA